MQQIELQLLSSCVGDLQRGGVSREQQVERRSQHALDEESNERNIDWWQVGAAGNSHAVLPQPLVRSTQVEKGWKISEVADGLQRDRPQRKQITSTCS